MVGVDTRTTRLSGNPPNRRTVRVDSFAGTNRDAANGEYAIPEIVEQGAINTGVSLLHFHDQPDDDVPLR